MKISEILNQDEGKTLEFKRDLSSPRPVLKTLVAFANTAGGRLLIGIDDGRRVIGVEDPLNEGKDKADIFDHIELYDHLPLAVDSIMLFLKKHAMRGADFSEIRRKDVWSIPLDILREVIINALVHSDYSQRGAPIRVAFFDDRIEVENPGILLPGMTIEDMKQGVSKIRNPVIARVFRELDLIEQWGSGIPQIFAAAQRMKLPEPQIMEIGMRVRFIVPLAEALSALRPQHGTRSGVQSGALMEALVAGPLSSAELIAVLGRKSKTGAFKRSIRELLEQGLIEYTIPDKPKSRLQKYRLKS